MEEGDGEDGVYHRLIYFFLTALIIRIGWGGGGGGNGGDS